MYPVCTVAICVLMHFKPCGEKPSFPAVFRISANRFFRFPLTQGLSLTFFNSISRPAILLLIPFVPGKVKPGTDTVKKPAFSLAG